MNHEDFDLSKKDRLMLSFLSNVLSKLDPVNSKEWDLNCKILDYGFSTHYSYVFQNIVNPLSHALQEKVHDILQYYNDLSFYLNCMQKEENKFLEYSVNFTGFYTDKETDAWHYCRFLILDLGYFSLLKKEDFDYNSHLPTLKITERFIEKWKSIDKDFFSNEKVTKELLDESPFISKIIS